MRAEYFFCLVVYSGWKPVKLPTLGRYGQMDHYLWFCDNCGIIPGGSGGMTFANNLQCVECQHYRCEFCITEPIRITEPMWGRKRRKRRKMIREAEKTLDEHRDSLFSHLPSSPPMPTISLALLQKVPTEKQV